MNKVKQGLRVDARRPTAIVSMLAFAFIIPMHILGYADRLNRPAEAVTLVLFPVTSAFLMIVVMLKFGRKALWVSVFPVSLGVLGFVFKLMIDPRGTSLLHHASAIVLYLAIVALWSLTVLYVIRTKWILALLFPVPFFKHIIMDDIPVLIGATPPISASAWMKEFSMLFFMLALSLCAESFEHAGQ